MTLFILRILFALLMAGGGGLLVSQYSSEQIYLLAGSALGAAIAIVIMVSARNFRRVSTLKVLGGVVGLIIGLACGYLVSSAFVYLPTANPEATVAIGILVKLIFTYLGIVLGMVKTADLSIADLRAMFENPESNDNVKILDTSVIIDGRIADICETGFLDGQMIIPQFILKELQQIADSTDGLKRNRSRRGLDVLKKIQKNADINVQIIDMDFPKVREVDAKLVELGKKLSGKVVTNDFNLNKVAELQGVGVLNINQLANAVKPVVLPGEMMHVYVLKEGKEYGQGVAYLDDGTMVVIDNARKYIGRNVEVSVTSVLQTSAGRMIFTKLFDDMDCNEHMSHRSG